MMNPKHKHERFQFLTTVFDVAKAWEITNDNRETLDCDVSSWFHKLVAQNDKELDENGRLIFDPLTVWVDTEKAMTETVSTDIPLIFANWEYKPGKTAVWLIDGHHRLYKAGKTGLDTMPAYLLSKEETDSIITRLL
jgi:hypothetical protein